MLILSGCGTKSQEDVVSDLTEKMDELNGYKTTAKMTLQMGAEPQEYEVEIWHKDPDLYRVKLKNAEKDQSQMILRNKEGVFVLTPALNKSFRFQSEWPENSSQPYLYESLVKDIMEDPAATYKETKEHYIFQTKTRYQNNKMLPIQEVTLSKKDLAPVSVKVMDPDHQTLVSVDFNQTEFNKKFDDNAFDMAKNMEGGQLDKETMAKESSDDFAVLYIDETGGYDLLREQNVEIENGARNVQFYGMNDERVFTLVQEKAEVMPAAPISIPVNGTPVDLGFALGAVTDTSVNWTYDGVEYTLASGALSPDEMVMLARTVQGTVVK